MSKQIFISSILSLILYLSACTSTEKSYDASGSFEAIERTISAEATGKIVSLNLEEGQLLKAGDTIGQIDITNLQLQAEQIESSINAIGKKTNDANPQIDIYKSQILTHQGQISTIKQQIEVLDKEINRFQNLVTAQAAPQKQLDDLMGQKSVLLKQLEVAQSQVVVLEAQINSAKRNVNIQNRSILSEVEPNEKRLEIINKQINDGSIISDYPGTVTTKLAYDGEFTAMGKPLYKIADLTDIILRAYISGDQLAQIKINDIVTVLTDDGSGGSKEKEGKVTWISNKGEFTPKTIQTKNERANMVYAIKIKVVNDGSYKIGMYGEVKFSK